MLVASKLENGSNYIEGEITPYAYIKMTLALLNDLDIKTSFEGNVIKVSKSKVKQRNDSGTD
jgi:3-phosphoshikimate 1-carboxyvinyltransferase